MTPQELNCPSVSGGIVPGPQWVPKSPDARVPRTRGHRSEHTVGPSSLSTDSQPAIDNSAGVNEKDPRLSVCPSRSNRVVHGSAVKQVTTRGRGAKGSLFPEVRNGGRGHPGLLRPLFQSGGVFSHRSGPAPPPADQVRIPGVRPERLRSLHRKRGS